jgi:hypothetical protein
MHEDRASWERAQRALGLADEANERLAEGAGQRAADAAEARHQERTRMATAAQQNEATQRSVEQIIDRKLADFRKQMTEAAGAALGQVRAQLRKERNEAELRFAEALGGEMGRFDKEQAELLRAEIKAAIDALRTEIKAELDAAARIAELERRLEEAERRAAPAPRQIGWRRADDAA